MRVGGWEAWGGGRRRCVGLRNAWKSHMCTHTPELAQWWTGLHRILTTPLWMKRYAILCACGAPVQQPRVRCPWAGSQPGAPLNFPSPTPPSRPLNAHRKSPSMSGPRTHADARLSAGLGGSKEKATTATATHTQSWSGHIPVGAPCLRDEGTTYAPKAPLPWRRPPAACGRWHARCACAAPSLWLPTQWRAWWRTTTTYGRLRRWVPFPCWSRIPPNPQPLKLAPRWGALVTPPHTHIVHMHERASFACTAPSKLFCGGLRNARAHTACGPARDRVNLRVCGSGC
jgi:hypothetical protein